MNRAAASADHQAVGGWTVELPGGLLCPDGRLVREATLRPVTGRDEERLATIPAHLGLPGLVTDLLAASLERLGHLEPATPALVRQLLVADRDFLLLVLRQRTFGDRVQAVLGCPACGEKMDIEFALADVVVTHGSPAGTRIGVELAPEPGMTAPARTARRSAELRLPTGADQEEVAAASPGGAVAAVDLLLARCLLRIGPVEQVDGAVVAELGPHTRQQLDDALFRASPAVDLDMDLNCPACRHRFTQWFEVAAFLRDELELHRDTLYGEVHVLATHYHWSESEILGLPRQKRRRYLGLVLAAGRASGASEAS